MTRIEALEILQAVKFLLPTEEYSDMAEEALDMAIEALEQYENAFEHGYTEAESEYREILERKRGEWIERNVTQDRRDAKIQEWQSAKCSVCGKYHTTPYMYYFTNYDYCPNCGSDMRGDTDESKRAT